MTPAELKVNGIYDESVLRALALTDRNAFSIGADQIVPPEEGVGLMVQLLLEGLEGRKLPFYIAEIGTGSGYGTCVLARSLPGQCEIETFERIFPLYEAAVDRVRNELPAYDTIKHQWASGENLARLYDGIIVTAACSHEQMAHYALSAPVVVAISQDAIFRITRGQMGPTFERICSIMGATPLRSGVE